MSVHKAFFVVVVMVFVLGAASLGVFVFVDDGVEGVYLACTDGDGAGLEDGAVHVHT